MLGRNRDCTLKGLERDGLVLRTAMGTAPLKVEYELTELGRSLWGPIEALGRWAEDHQHLMEQARKRFDGDREVEPFRQEAA